jgi:hypothetical protein
MEIIVYLVAYIVNILIVGQPRQAGEKGSAKMSSEGAAQASECH